MSEKITVEAVVAAPMAEVWRAYTTPDDIKQWNAASDDWHTTSATVDLRVGGSFSSRMEAKDGSMGFDFAGTYTAIVEHSRIDYAFGDRSASVLFSETPAGVKVTVIFDAETMHTLEQQREGWQAILNNFAKHVASRLSQSIANTAATPKNRVCLWYDRDAVEAAKFYAQTFPNSSVGAVHLAPGDNPSSKEGAVLTVEFTVLGIPCIGINGGPAVTHNWAFSFQILTVDQAETDHYWNVIVGNGGEESQCGWCKDKWGIHWQITPVQLMQATTSADRAAAKRAFTAMMQMKKIDIQAIEAAFKGGA
jgi:predicted 3-demethylubiquinone-9 3-methyltransferase (glyoxalase superfamily)/uncharacterized protein YndB with AHSA1/START domain